MKTSRYSDSQILSILKQAESGTRPQSSLGLPGIRHQRDLLVLPADTVGRKCGDSRLAYSPDRQPEGLEVWPLSRLSA